MFYFYNRQPLKKDYWKYLYCPFTIYYPTSELSYISNNNQRLSWRVQVASTTTKFITSSQGEESLRNILTKDPSNKTSVLLWKWAILERNGMCVSLNKQSIPASYATMVGKLIRKQALSNQIPTTSTTHWWIWIFPALPFPTSTNFLGWGKGYCQKENAGTVCVCVSQLYVYDNFYYLWILNWFWKYSIFNTCIFLFCA